MTWWWAGSPPAESRALELSSASGSAACSGSWDHVKVRWIRLGCCGSCRICWEATTSSVASSGLLAVLVCRIQRGWLLEVTSTRMRCPGKNVTAVAWRSMHSSYAVPGVTLTAGSSSIRPAAG